MKENIKSLKVLSVKLLLLAVINIICITKLFAGVEHFVNKIDLCEIQNGAIFTVADDKYAYMVQNPITWTNDFTIKEYSKGRLILKLDPNDKTIYPSFTATANVSVTYVKQDLTTGNFTTTLNLSYNPATATFTTDENIYHFSNAHSMTVTLTTISSTLASIPKGLILKGEIDVERYYTFNHTTIPTVNYSIVDVDFSIDRTIGIDWPVIIGAEEYDLEWTFIDDYNSLGASKPLDFKNNATRVTLNDNYYEIPLVFEKGYLLYRVRAVGKLAPDFNQRVEGAWSSEAFTYTNVSGYPDKYYVNEHEADNFNWGYQSFYTENGVRGEGVSYFDGTLRNRQNTSKLNTTDKVVVQETFYDYQGRPVISALPSPIEERFFKYRDDFNQNTTSQEFSVVDFDLDISSPEMGDASGASNYYSPLNPNLDGFNAYIPDAENFPFTQTEYKNDLTGRIKTQGGLGSNHKIGSGHESKFYYGKPLQYKLTSLFGTDVGFSSSYSETMVIDPNGQASVSVMDASGRVIITNLAGDPPANLEGLPSHAAKEQITASILDNTIDEQDGYGSIISTQSYISKAGGLHEFSYSLNPETYDPCLTDAQCFDCVYELTISVQDVDNMNEMLTGGPFKVTIGNNSPLNTTCENSIYNSPTDATLKVNLPIGSYIITKELRVNKAAIEYYADQYIKESDCLDDYHSFFDAFIAETDFSGCNIDPCLLSCEEQYGTSSEWLLANPTMDIDDYNALIESCKNACVSPKSPCEEYEAELLADMSKGGQYGLYFNETTLAIDVTSFPLSIFNLGNKLPDNWSNLTVQTRGTGANWTIPSNVHPSNPTAHYYDADGVTLSLIPIIDLGGSMYDPAVYDPGTNLQLISGAYYVYPEHLLNVEDFLANWKPSWANALVPYHPEYCHLGFLCEETFDDITWLHEIYLSGLYDQDMMETNSYADALAAGFLNPINNAIPTLTYVSPGDPFYSYLVNTSNPSATPFYNSIVHYNINSTETDNLWDLAFAMVYCPNPTGYTNASIASCLSSHSSEYYGNDICKKDLVWQTFRDLYLANKAAFFDLESTNYAIEHGCYNGCIGTASFAKADFDFDCYEWPLAPSPLCSASPVKYDGNADYKTTLNQPCSDNTYANYANKVKVFTTIYEDYPPSAFPPSASTINAQMIGDIATFCDNSCEIYANDWIAQLSNCSNIATVQVALKAELKELCGLQCDPLNTSFPTTTVNGNKTVEEVIEYHILHSNYTSTCHPLLLMHPGPTQPTYSPDQRTNLDECGCDKILQNEYDFINVTPLPATVTTAQQLFYYNYGFIPVNYENIKCECNNAASTWSPGHTWLTGEKATLSTLAMPVTDELACEKCLSCTEIASYKSDFDLTANYAFLSSDPDYFLYLTNYINSSYNYSLSANQVQDFVTNCNLLSSSGNTVWSETTERVHLEMLLKKLASFGDLLQSTPFNLLTYIGNTSLEQHSNDYYCWSTASNNCTNNTLELNVGTSGGTSQCTITLDLTTAKSNGYNIDYCNIISLDNLRKRGTTCSNTKDFYIDAIIIDGLQSVLVTIEGTSSCYPIANCASSSSELSLCNNIYNYEEEDECTAFLIQTAEDNALQAYLQYLQEEKDKFTAALKTKCMSAVVSETFDMTYWDQEHHFTLYYYDQSGGLVQTVPPEGVKPFASPAADIAIADGYRIAGSGVKTPPHVLLTKYRYNTYNQLTEQATPDAGKSNFWYDIAGRLIASQNAKQAISNLYSYTIYDDFGRIVEVGEKDPASYMTQIIAEDPTSLATWYSGGTNSQITRTFYDEALSPTIDGYFASGQENLRLRVSTVAYYEIYAVNTDYDNAIHYSYDIAGNVKYAVMENTDLEGLSSSLKLLNYNYDLVSGNVNQVIFQEGETDQYYHKYSYDADNRIHEVNTSKDGVIWEKDAKYFYYDHGPLARIEMGDDKVQGIDLAYTIQGWLKGVNSNTLYTNRDIGKDGTDGYFVNLPKVHNAIAKDAFGYTLDYFNGDYEAISQPTAINNFEASVASTPLDVANTELFNGNIRSMVTAINGMSVYGNSYKYDQLNRLRTSTVFDNVDLVNNRWTTGTALSDYYTDITYDANGNILSLQRNGTTSPQLAMDNMNYAYYAGTNRLADVTDIAPDHASYTDIKTGMSVNNYTYDAIGNLITDPSEQIDNIDWTVYGKVKSITRTGTSSKPDLEFKYDAMGNRIMKLVKPRTGSGLTDELSWVYNYYQYDAGGNLLSIYEKTFSGSLGNYTATYILKETNLYGSSRLGIDEIEKTLVTQNFTASIDIYTHKFTGISIISTTPVVDDPNLVSRILGDKTYELSNHLGNVLATISDKKLPLTGTLSNTIISSSFEGNDYNFFKTGDYSSLQVTHPVKTGAYAITTTSTDPYGPEVYLYNIKDGDVIAADIWGNIYPAAAGGSFILELKNACTMQNIATTSLPTLSSNPQTVDYWQNLVFNYVVPTTGLDELIVVLKVSNVSASTTSWDDLTINVTHNTSQIIAYDADITSRQMYYPFGSVMPNANNLNAAGHTYGFQGQMNDNEIKGNGNSVNYRFRMHDPRLGRFFAVDPLTWKYPFYSPYAFSGNRVINAVELEGLEPKDVAKIKIPKGGAVAPRVDVAKVTPKGYTGGLTPPKPNGVPLPTNSTGATLSQAPITSTASMGPNWSLLFNPITQAKVLIGAIDNIKTGENYFNFNVGVTYGLQLGVDAEIGGVKGELYGNAISDEFIRYSYTESGNSMLPGFTTSHDVNYWGKNGKVISTEGWGAALLGGYEYQKTFVKDITQMNKPKVELQTDETISILVGETTITNNKKDIKQKSAFKLGAKIAALIGLDISVEFGATDKKTK